MSEVRPGLPVAPRIAVVGGGVAGLVAARELALHGAEVELFERAPRLGGRVRSVPLQITTPTEGDHIEGGATGDGRGVIEVEVEVGAEAFATRGGMVGELITALGLEAEIVRPAPHGSWVVANGRALPLPPGGALGIPTTPLRGYARRILGGWGAFRAAIEPWLPRAPLAANATVADLVRARLGRRVLERIVRPITLGVHSSEPDRLPVTVIPGLAEAYTRSGSLLRAARELHTAHVAAGGAVAALRGGITPLIIALTEDLQRRGVALHVRSEVAALRRAPDAAWHIDSVSSAQGGAAGDPRSETFDAVLLAVPRAEARALLAALTPGGLDDAPAAPATEVEVIALAIADSRLDAAPRGTGALVAPGDAEIAAKALTHVTAKWPDRGAGLPPGTHVLRLSYGRAGSAPETALLPDSEAIELARRDASRILGIPLERAAIRDAQRARWAMSAPPSPGARPAVSCANDPELAGIALAGDWVHGTGLASVIPGARQAAADLLHTGRPRTTPNHTDRTVHHESQVRLA